MIPIRNDHASREAQSDRLAVRNARKVYGGTVALAGVDFSLRPGEIHALVGENGAGKSTLVRLMAGIEQADDGSMHVEGEEVGRHGRITPAAVRAAGIVFIHQDLALIPQLSVTENVALFAGYAQRHRLINWRRSARRASDVIRGLGLEVPPHRTVGSLPVSSQAMVALARALAVNAKVLVLDEPTANLSDDEAERMHAVLRRLRDTGVSSVLISHRIDEVLALADRATVLRDGHAIATVDCSRTSKTALLELMLGANAEHLLRPADAPAPRLTGCSTKEVGEHSKARRRRVVELRDVVTDELCHLDLNLDASVVTGATGMAGSGFFALAEVLVGARKHEGTIELDGRPYRPTAPHRAVSAGIAFVPADRKQDGAAPRMSLRENVFLNPAGDLVMMPSSERRKAAQVLNDFQVMPCESEAEFSTLSGGNAQKVILARALHRDPALIVACEPTAAVDVGARRQIHKRFRDAAQRGAAVLIASTDTAELVEVCDRVLVFDRGRHIATLQQPYLTLTALRKAIQSDDSTDETR